METLLEAVAAQEFVFHDLIVVFFDFGGGLFLCSKRRYRVV
jgi:hypothetical protein